MKRLLIFLGFLLVSVAVEAQPTEKDGYRPMLKEGKAWNYIYVKVDIVEIEDGRKVEEETEIPERFYLKGDTIIGGKKCMKMYLNAQGRDTYDSSWYEEDYKVYRIMEDETEAQLIFDFGLQIGERPTFQFGELLSLASTDQIEVNGRRFYRQHFTSTEVYEWTWEDASICVAGVGGSYGVGGFFNGGFYDVTTCICDYSYFISCEEDGEVIFTKDDFNKEAYVEPEPIVGYHPFVKEGKAWNYKEYEYEMLLDEGASSPEEEVYYRGTIKEIRDFCLVFSGDTIVGGHNCKKLYRKDISVEHSVPSYVSAWYEEGRKVYCIEKGNVTPKVLYDFSASLGEKLNVFTGVSVFVSNEDLVEVNGKTFLRQYIGTENDDIENKEYMLKCVSGVGTFMGVEYGCGKFTIIVAIPYNKDDNITTEFISCEEDGEVIFTKDDFNKEPFTDGIHSVEVNAPLLKHGKTYDLQGREVTTPQSGHIYIKDGRKFMAK